ncbi:MAG: FtsW/RodA/SpoVE family cell cycle protein, partial [Mailhella sp.]|nr:FtsW/RodA/SpoVE family cell cycle protein [Mailhella sp.]
MNLRRPKPEPVPVPEQTPPGSIDWWLLAIFLLLLSVGLLAVLSASGPQSQRLFGTSYHFFQRQLQTMALGGAAVAVLGWVPRNFIYRLHYWGI